jgi:hypothetical protein
MNAIGRFALTVLAWAVGTFLGLVTFAAVMVLIELI